MRVLPFCAPDTKKKKKKKTIYIRMYATFTVSGNGSRVKIDLLRQHLFLLFSLLLNLSIVWRRKPNEIRFDFILDLISQTQPMEEKKSVRFILLFVP